MGETYVGTKFKTVFKGEFAPNAEQRRLIRSLISVGHEFKKLGLIDENGGNISVRSGNGFIIKRTGSHPDKLRASDFVFVAKVSGDKVFALGESEPSSEARLHALVYKARGDAKAVLHAHDKKALQCSQKLKGVMYLPEIPYGTQKSAMAVAKASKKADYIIQNKHGIVAIGKDIKSALKLIRQNHARFCELSVKPS